MITIKRIINFAYICTAILVAFETSVHAAGIKLKKNQIVKVTGGTCGLLNNRWKPVKKSGKSYTADSQAKTKVKAACKKLLTPKALKNSGLSRLPSTASLVVARSGASSAIGTQAVSGTPPLLTDIPGQVRSIFWQPGVVEGINEGSPSEQQCREFIGQSDGGSGGIVACYMTQQVGHSFQSIIESGTSLCYMKKFPSANNLTGGAIELVRGEFPDNDISKIFSVPNGSTQRVVKVNVLGPSEDQHDQSHATEAGQPREHIFIRVDNTAENARNGNQYAVSLYFCGLDTMRQYERTAVSAGGAYSSLHIDTNNDQTFSADVRGFLISQGADLVFDSSRNRVAELSFSRGSQAFSGEVTVTPQNILLTKSHELFDGLTRNSFGVSEFSGTGISTLRFLQGAYKDSLILDGNTFGGFNGGVEFHDTFYASAADNQLVSQLDAVDLSSDSFYQSELSGSPELPEFDCGSTPDLEINLDMGAEILQTAIAECRDQQLNGMDYCRSDESVNQAEQQFFQECAPPQSPH